jgi:hypothetical protein
MKINKHIFIVIFAFVVLAGAALYVYRADKANIEEKEFLSSLGNLSNDSATLARINGFKIENKNNGSLGINGFVADPGNNEYYTDKPVQLAEFASSTNLSIKQINDLINFATKYSYI